MERDISCPTDMRSKYESDWRCRWANRRERRSNSTARLTWPETQRRTAPSPKRTRHTTTTATTSGASALRSPAVRLSSITRPVRYGKVMEHAISPAAQIAVIATLPE